MMPPDKTSWRVLIPFDAREGVNLSHAAALAGKSEPTLRNRSVEYGLGRRFGGGTWVVSYPALLMFLEGNKKALNAYYEGERSSELVTQYYCRCGVPIPTILSARSSRQIRRVFITSEQVP
ncbi:hypothetical protein [Bradyrhizobium sp. LMTR 3]|uniref:hypothetical protein n=1 Tax=Bradyrhizobium sp. LMTR 3 TaxID=189873 RepID=UPI00159EF99F|nr:hypothetical protein [Bradyrhizobium sp. LMTR 3]